MDFNQVSLSVLQAESVTAVDKMGVMWKHSTSGLIFRDSVLWENDFSEMDCTHSPGRVNSDSLSRIGRHKCCL